MARAPGLAEVGRSHHTTVATTNGSEALVRLYASSSKRSVIVFPFGKLDFQGGTSSRGIHQSTFVIWKRCCHSERSEESLREERRFFAALRMRFVSNLHIRPPPR